MGKVTIQDSRVFQEYGFCYVLTSDNLVIQCSLSKSRLPGRYLKQISKKNCGMLDGVCFDVPEKAIDKYGLEKCMQLIFSEMSKLGVRIVK